MEMTVCNPQKGRLETIYVEISEKNTTWFDNCLDNEDIYMITDFKGGLIIKELGYTYPTWIYDVSRDDIGQDRKKIRELIDRCKSP